MDPSMHATTQYLQYEDTVESVKGERMAQENVCVCDLTFHLECSLLVHQLGW